MGTVISFRKEVENEPTCPEDALVEAIEAAENWARDDWETICIAILLLSEDERLEDCRPSR